MLTSELVRVRVVKDRVDPLYIDRNDPHWLDMAESLLVIFREGKDRTRGELWEDVDALLGHDPRTLVPRGMAKVLEDRGEFEVVSEVEPEVLRKKVFDAAAAARREQAERAGRVRGRFDAEAVLSAVGSELGLSGEQIRGAMFADLKDENRMSRFEDISAQRLIDRYNVALAQAVLLKSTAITIDVRGESPARYRQLFRWLKFHRLMARATGRPEEGYVLQIDGPLSVLTATTRYGVQIASFLPALLNCQRFRLEAELRWGGKKEPKRFLLSSGDGLQSPQPDTGTYASPEWRAFVERFQQVARGWEVEERVDLISLGQGNVWVPDACFVHRASGTEVHVEYLGFWRRSAVERLAKLLPEHGPRHYLLLISDRLKLEPGGAGDLGERVVRFKEIPNAPEVLARLEKMLPKDAGEERFVLR
jgi:predicted nuclease of restriction endonuclease-like RecB superfamily